MSSPRGIDERINYMLNDYTPADFGMCAQTCWHVIGGDLSPANPPAWGCSDANEVYDKVKASGRYWTGTPKRGALVLWKYGSNGHAAICYDDAGSKICTTDPSDQGNTPTTGVEPIGYPSKWGATTSARIWTDQYNGVRFAVGELIGSGDVYVDKLRYRQDDSDSVKRLQDTLNGISLSGGSELPVTGYYGDQTKHEVMLWQTQKATDKTIINGSEVTNEQADQLFAGSGHTVIHTGAAEPPTTPPGEPGTVSWDNYSGKPSGTLTVADDAGYIQVDASVPDPPTSGLEFHMLYANCDITWDSGTQDGWIRVKYVREGGDATAYQDYSVVRGMADFLLTAQHWEAGEAGIGGRWQINVGGGIAKVVIGTRYVKGAGVVYQLDS